jgi:hypothetical protein
MTNRIDTHNYKQVGVHVQRPDQTHPITLSISSPWERGAATGLTPDQARELIEMLSAAIETTREADA